MTESSFTGMNVTLQVCELIHMPWACEGLYQDSSFKRVIGRGRGAVGSRSTEVSSLPEHDVQVLRRACVEPFEDEIHPRLRWAHRGLVGMANNGRKNSNDSQFIITLGMYSRRFTGKHD